MSTGNDLLLVGTGKGAFVLQRNAAGTWDLSGPSFAGRSVYAMMLDTRKGRNRLWAAAQSMHFGAELVFSDDLGKTWDTPEEMRSQEYQEKLSRCPRGIITVFPNVSMGKNLGLTLVYFLVVTSVLAYLAALALPPGAAFMSVFRFVASAALLAFLSAILSHAIWFHNRVVGHVIESVAYALIVGAIFAAMWPASG